MKLRQPLSPPCLVASPKTPAVYRSTCEWRGASLTLSVGERAGQASQAVWLEHEQTVILATLTDGPPPAQADFRPLTVDYQERPGAIGAVPGGSFRREGRPSDYEVKVSRLIDRALRPLFDEEERRELHVMVTVLSASPKADLVGLSILAAGAAAQCSELPFKGPVAGQRRLDEGEEWVVAAHREGVVMLEGGGSARSAEALSEELTNLAGELTPLWRCVEELYDAVSPSKVAHQLAFEALEHPAFEARLGALADALTLRDKRSRDHAYKALLAELIAEVDAPAEAVSLTLWSLARAWLRAEALEGRRQDGRSPHELRPMTIQMGVLPRAAGSALITKGDTQVLVNVTHTGGEAPSVKGITDPHQRSGLLCHYNFPPFATHEVRGRRSLSRREIGHGLIMQRGLQPYFQPKAPNLMSRALADVLSSDGSSSMLSTCGATLALAQAEAPLLSPVVGLSIGLISEGEGDAQEGLLLMDISGDEDYYGDMDLKVSGSAEGVTALHLDNKLGALPWVVIHEALSAASQAHVALLESLKPHLEGFAEARVRYEEQVKLAPQRLGRVIGKQGSNLKALSAELEVHVDIAEDGLTTVTGFVEEAVKEAISRLRAQGEPLKVGQRFNAEVDGVKDYGIFVTFGGHSGLVHVSEMSQELMDFKRGDLVEVKLIGTDKQGRLKLSTRGLS